MRKIANTLSVEIFGELRRHSASEASRDARKLLVGPWYHSPWSRLTGATDFALMGEDRWMEGSP